MVEWSLDALVERAVERFHAEFGRGPVAVAAAPGRVNLIGEHTDYNGGLVLPMAIDRWCVAVGSLAAGARGLVVSGAVGESVTYGTSGRNAAGLPAWARYAVGAVWCAADEMQRDVAADVVIESSVPPGGGLSSSAAVELACAALADELAGGDLEAEKLAAVAHEAEHRYAGVPCGWMDQTVCALAEEGSALLIDCRTMARRAVSLPRPDEAVVVVADSGVRHSLAAGEYRARRATCERAASTLGVEFLREVDASSLTVRGGGLSPEELACVRHVTSENERVHRFAAALGAGDLEGAGRLMRESHASLRDDYRVSCVELNAMVEAAARTPGVLGSRMTGGGFGGCTVTLCRPEAVDRLSGALSGVTARGALRPFVARAVGGVRARRL